MLLKFKKKMFLSRSEFPSEKFYNQMPSPEKFKNLTLTSPKSKLFTPCTPSKQIPPQDPSFQDFLSSSKNISIDIISYSKEFGAEIVIYD